MFDEYRDIMTIDQIAQALGVGKNTAYRLIHEREIGSRRVGHKFIIPKSCLIDFVQSARYTVRDAAD